MKTNIFKRHLNTSIVIGLIMMAMISSCNESKDAQNDNVTKPTYVIVHGAWGGSWAFKEVEQLLRAKGCEVYRPSMTGQGERVHLAKYLKPDLTMHIEDIVNAIIFEDLHEVILVGHSYGGMVVTGVTDSIPDRIKKLIYLDAMVPFDGESVATINGGTNEEMIAANPSGFWIPPWINLDAPYPSDVPHPLGTLTENIQLSGKGKEVPTAYILTVDKGATPESDGFFVHAERARAFGWPVSELEADHNAQWSAPKELTELLYSLKP